MTQPIPPTVVIADIARETTLEGVQALIITLIEKVDILMSEDATVAAEVAAEEASIGALTTAVGSMQSLITALQAEPQPLTPATMAAMAKVQTDLAAVAATAAADVAADTPVPPVSGA